jgi:hypothetical protein
MPPSPRTVFIVRPFNIKEGIDFDAVEARLIRPVIDELKFQGGTTGEFAHAGSIRADMMQELLLADIVIADISIHNANVYYELGVRHALRDKATVLIRCGSADVPFDLKTDRYLEYDAQRPEGSRGQLRKAIESTLARDSVDSPVFQLLPDVRPHDVAALLPVPRLFREAVALAAADREAGLLALMAREVDDRPWRIGARLLIGQALFDLKANKAAMATFQDVVKERPDDPQANLLLATLQVRLGDVNRSNVTLARLKELRDVPAEVRREGLALLGRNQKVQWVTAWIGEVAPERQRIALGSPLLAASQQNYRKAFVEDPRSYYAGLNALSMVMIQEQLATAQPQAWIDAHDDEHEAASQLNELKRSRPLLTHAVAFALEAAEASSSRRADDPWLAVSKADHFLLSQASPGKVRSAYEGVRQLSGSGFQADAAARQLSLYRELGLFPQTVDVALTALGYPGGVMLLPQEAAKGLVIVGTGHRIDAPGDEPRFPGDEHTVARARDALRRAVEECRRGVQGPVRGISALASGADILFHEVCAELGISTQAYLPLPPDAFKSESVADGGQDWIRRFDELCGQLEVHVLGDSKDRPPWVRDERYGAFQRGNLWLLETAFAEPHANVSLIALWDGNSAKGVGGTSDMVNAARQRGAVVRIVDPKTPQPA